MLMLRLLAVFFGVFLFASGASAHALDQASLVKEGAHLAQGETLCPNGHNYLAPSAVTEGAQYITSSSGQLNGRGHQADPLCNSGPLLYFRYGTASNCNGTRVPASGYLATVDAHVEYMLTGLFPNTTYYYCMKADGGAGTGNGAVVSFRTLGTAPVVTTGVETAVTAVGATLTGTADPNGTATTIYFRYGTNSTTVCTALGSVSSSVGAGSGQNPVNVWRPIGSLQANTTYYYCIVGVSSNGTRYGAVASLHTLSKVPAATTGAVTDVTLTGGTLNGTVNPYGTATNAWFRYGTANAACVSLPLLTTVVPKGAGQAVVPSSQVLTGLGTNTTYYYCAGANNAAGATYGAVSNFKTGVIPPTADLQVYDPTTSTWGDEDISITSWQNIQLRWTSTNATSCSGTNFTASGTGDPPYATQSIVTEPAPAASTVYTVTCTGTGGSATDSITVDTAELVAGDTECSDLVDNDGDTLVDMNDPGCVDDTDNNETNSNIFTAMSLTASPARVRTGETTTISWNTGGRKICFIQGSNSDDVGDDTAPIAHPTGSHVTDPISGVVTYTLSCTDDVVPVTKTITILRVPSVQEI